MVNDIKNNTNSEALAKQKLNALNKIKKAETKHKRLINRQKILLKLFDDLLETISFVKKENNNNNNVSVNENENENKNENENENEIENENVNKIENENVNKTDVNIDTNNYFNIIDKTKSFADKIETPKKMEDDFSQYWNLNYYDDNKKLNFNIFQLKFAHISNDVDEQLFEEMFGHKYVALADKLLNTKSKEDNQIFINDIKKNRDKIYEQDDSSNYVIQQIYKRSDLISAIDVILNFNEIIQLDLS